MKPEKIIEGHQYEISVGKTPAGGVKKAVVKVIEKNLITKTWLCESEDGKEVKVKDPARFLKEIKPKEERAASPEEKEPKEKTESPQIPKGEVPDSVKESLKTDAMTAQKKVKIAMQALEIGIGSVTQDDVTKAEQEAKAAKERAIAAGVIFGGSSGRARGQMGGKSAALLVLREEGRPLRAKELCELAHERGYCELTGSTPEATIAAAIATDIKVKGENSQFMRVGAGLFAIREQ